MILDENFWKIIQGNQKLLSRINQGSSLDGITEKAYIERELNKSDNNYVKNIYNAWVNQGKPPSYAVRMSIARVTPSIPGPSRGKGITKRKKRRKPRKKKSVKKRKGKSKKKRVRRKRKSRRRS